jgi:hypothetical protein
MSLRRSQRLQTNIKETETVTDNIVSKKRVKPTTIEEQIITDNITDNINYYSYFFRKDIVSNYISDLNNKINLLKQENPSLKTPMDYYKIYNLDSILEYCGTKTTYNLRSNPQNEEEKKNNAPPVTQQKAVALISPAASPSHRTFPLPPFLHGFRRLRGRAGPVQRESAD